MPSLPRNGSPGSLTRTSSLRPRAYRDSRQPAKYFLDVRAHRRLPPARVGLNHSPEVAAMGGFPAPDRRSRPVASTGTKHHERNPAQSCGSLGLNWVAAPSNWAGASPRGGKNDGADRYAGWWPPPPDMLSGRARGSGPVRWYPAALICKVTQWLRNEYFPTRNRDPTVEATPHVMPDTPQQLCRKPLLGPVSGGLRPRRLDRRGRHERRPRRPAPQMQPTRPSCPARLPWGRWARAPL
ncbi:hypothetical protein J2X01_002519 [Arthrobacter ginsengisoli]|uniref:Uncharacterized protein n=1 Tax=Arthrobacter ginsengisoli TaxID=1356565 RepID=A0ABU1UDH3_9MICC|nr:hypothetical protein [Arthrobacter ginsengisoli]